FPVVTVAHKLLLPFSPQLLRLFERPLSALGPVVAGAIAGTTAFLLPGVFGFLVWEFKENWKLYRASRARILRPARVGHHGETVSALLVPGFHSGTIPKVFARLRRAAQRAESSSSDSLGVAQRANASHGRFREALQELEEALTRFVERELVALL